jgi:hypothetical protein
LNEFVSGDLLCKTNEGYANKREDLVLKFLKKFVEGLTSQERKGYNLKDVKTNIVLNWKKPKEEKETQNYFI